MRISFTGAQSTGKSTHASMLSGYTLVPSASRFVAKEGMPVNRAGTLSSQITIAGKMEIDMHRMKDVPNTVWERSHIDIYAYGTAANLSPARDECLAVIKALALKQMHTYFDMVFYFPAYDIDNFVGAEDGIRDCDVDYRDYIDDIILNTLKELKVDYITVPCGTIKDVHRYIEDKITMQDFDDKMQCLNIMKDTFLKNFN